MRHHGAGLLRLTRDEALVEQLIHDYQLASLNAGERSMLEFAAKLTRTPWKMTQADVESLRDHGFSDRAILQITMVTGYYAFVNRLADGLGVALEDFWKE